MIFKKIFFFLLLITPYSVNSQIDSSLNIITWTRADISDVSEETTGDLRGLVRRLGKVIPVDLQTEIGRESRGIRNCSINFLERELLIEVMDHIDYENSINSITLADDVLKFIPEKPDAFLFTKIEKQGIGWLKIRAKIVKTNSAIWVEDGFELPTGYSNDLLSSKIKKMAHDFVGHLCTTVIPPPIGIYRIITGSYFAGATGCFALAIIHEKKSNINNVPYILTMEKVKKWEEYRKFKTQAYWEGVTGAHLTISCLPFIYKWISNDLEKIKLPLSGFFLTCSVTFTTMGIISKNKADNFQEKIYLNDSLLSEDLVIWRGRYKSSKVQEKFCYINALIDLITLTKILIISHQESKHINNSEVYLYYQKDLKLSFDYRCKWDNNFQYLIQFNLYF